MAQVVRVTTMSRPHASQSASTISIDTSELRNLAKQLRTIAPEAAKELRTGTRAAGQLVADEAKSRASFSTRIPATIKVRASGLGVKVVAGGDSAPDAAPLENQGREGTFRHPVFGNVKVWVDQPAHPFLAPALDAKADEIEAALLAAIDSALRTAGFM